MDTDLDSRGRACIKWQRTVLPVFERVISTVWVCQGPPSSGGLCPGEGFSNTESKTLGRVMTEAERSKTALAVLSAFPIQYLLPAQLVPTPAQQLSHPAPAARATPSTSSQTSFPTHTHTQQGLCCCPYKEPPPHSCDSCFPICL